MSVNVSDRRQILRLLAALCAALGTGAAPGYGDAPSCSIWLEAGDLEGARALGREYLTHHPADNGLGGVWPLLQSGAAAGPRGLAALSDMVRTDYERGRIVTLDGWLVSRTEARIFAAIATYC